MSKWMWQIKQDGLTVSKGFADDKEIAVTEASHYANQYFEETFSKMSITIKEIEDD